MHKKISAGLCITITVITLLITAVVTTAVTMAAYSTLISDLPEREAMYSTLSEIDGIVRNNYLGATEDETVNDGISQGYLSSLTIGRNFHMTADEYASYKASQQGTDINGAAVSSIKYEKFKNAGYIKILDFTDKTPDEFEKAFASLKSSSVTGFVIDVRDTDSINIESAAEIVDFIVPLATESTQAIATAVDKNGKNIKVFSADSGSIDMPLSVIINENTSGAGELLACDIRDFGKGRIVGKTSAGNGTYQQIFELSDGSAIVLTVAQLLPYSSDNYDNTGIKPDYEKELEKKTDKLSDDTQFMQAYASVITIK